MYFVAFTDRAYKTLDVVGVHQSKEIAESQVRADNGKLSRLACGRYEVWRASDVKRLPKAWDVMAG
jgi:hypothetical protein